MERNQPFEFICEDCRSHVYSYGGDPQVTRCHMCHQIHSMQLTAEKEKELRKALDCEIEGEEDNAKLGK
jgi:hypothetical protein